MSSEVFDSNLLIRIKSRKRRPTKNPIESVCGTRTLRAGDNIEEVLTSSDEVKHEITEKGKQEQQHEIS